MVGRPGYVDQLSRPVVFRRTGELLRLDDACRREIPGLSEVMDRYRKDLVEKNKDGLSPDGRGAGDAGCSAGVVAFSGRI